MDDRQIGRRYKPDIAEERRAVLLARFSESRLNPNVLRLQCRSGKRAAEIRVDSSGEVAAYG